MQSPELYTLAVCEAGQWLLRSHFQAVVEVKCGSNGTLLEPTNHPTRRATPRLGARTGPLTRNSSVHRCNSLDWLPARADRLESDPVGRDNTDSLVALSFDRYSRFVPVGCRRA